MELQTQTGSEGATTQTDVQPGGETVTAQTPVADARFDELQQKVNDLTGKLEMATELLGRFSQQPQQTSQQPQEFQLPENIETMSRAEFLEVQDRRNQQKFIQPIMDQLSALNNSIQQQQVRADIADTRAKNTDFDQWIPELREIAKRYPTIRAGDALALARNENPTKAAKLAPKQTQPTQQTPTPTQQQPARPGQAQPTTTATQTSTALSMSEALEQGWANNSAQLSAALDALDAA